MATTAAFMCSVRALQQCTVGSPVITLGAVIPKTLPVSDIELVNVLHRAATAAALCEAMRDRKTVSDAKTQSHIHQHSSPAAATKLRADILAMFRLGDQIFRLKPPSASPPAPLRWACHHLSSSTVQLSTSCTAAVKLLALRWPPPPSALEMTVVSSTPRLRRLILYSLLVPIPGCRHTGAQRCQITWRTSYARVC